MDYLTLAMTLMGGLLVLALGAGIIIGYAAARAVWREDVADAQARATDAERGAQQMADRYDALLATPHGQVVQRLTSAQATVDALLLRLSQLDSGPIDALIDAVQADAAPPPGRPPAARHRRPPAVRPYVRHRITP